jgi:hypothetical protein
MLLDLDRGAAVSAGDCGFLRRMVSVSTRRIRCCGYVEPDRIADMNVEPPALVRGIGGEYLHPKRFRAGRRWQEWVRRYGVGR